MDRRAGGAAQLFPVPGVAVSVGSGGLGGLVVGGGVGGATATVSVMVVPREAVDPAAGFCAITRSAATPTLRRVGSFEAETHFSRRLDRFARGEEIAITKT